MVSKVVAVVTKIIASNDKRYTLFTLLSHSKDIQPVKTKNPLQKSPQVLPWNRSGLTLEKQIGQKLKVEICYHHTS